MKLKVVLPFQTQHLLALLLLVLPFLTQHQLSLLLLVLQEAQSSVLLLLLQEAQSAVLLLLLLQETPFEGPAAWPCSAMLELPFLTQHLLVLLQLLVLQEAPFAGPADKPCPGPHHASQHMQRMHLGFRWWRRCARRLERQHLWECKAR